MEPSHDKRLDAECEEPMQQKEGEPTRDGSPTPDHCIEETPRVGQLTNHNGSGQPFITRILSNITIEPMLFLKMVAEGNFTVVADTLEVERVCTVNLGFDKESCAQMDNGNNTAIQESVQIYQNNFNFYQGLMDSLIPILLVLIFGFFSDKFGRKPAMISVLSGFTLLGIVYTLISLKIRWPVEVLYLGTLLVDLGGSWVVFNMAVYGYIADITTIQSRTKRMGIADAIWYSGFPLGVLLGGFLFKHFGYAVVFGVSTCLWLLCLFYVIFFIKESPKFESPQGDLEHNSTSEPQNASIFSLYKSFFRKRPKNAREHILILIALKLGVFLVQGHLVYPWARKLLQWDATDYSTWSSFDNISHQVGMVAFVWIAERLLWHNCTVAVGGLMSILLWSAILAAITGPPLWWLTIVASLSGAFEPAIEPAIRSMLTAIVGLGDEGKALAVMGLLEAAWLSVDKAFYTFLYNSVFTKLPQINFVVQASFALVLILITLWLKRRFIKAEEVQKVL